MAKRKKTRRRSAGRPQKKPVPAWLWLLAGLLLGLALATFGIIKGYIPQPKVDDTSQAPTAAVDAEPADEALLQPDGAAEEEQPRYDFFTVLPEMEVVVPEQELRQQAQDNAISRTGPYVLQAGSFRNAADADRLKASLALLGVVSKIQTVTVNDATWHRVRIGPYDSAREVEQLQIRLRDSGIDSRVFRDQ